MLNNLDAVKLVLGLAQGKRKKGKTKAQRQRRDTLESNKRYRIATPPRGYTVRQVCRNKFIVTGKDTVELYDFKRNTVTTIEKDSKIGGKYA
jgi:hypothetical protein